MRSDFSVLTLMQSLPHLGQFHIHQSRASITIILPAPIYGEIDYYLNPQRGAIPQWDNKFAVMSWAEWLTFKPMSQAKNINVPTLFVHSQKAAISNGARQFFNDIPSKNKSFVWLDNRTQFDFYDQEGTVNQAVGEVSKFLSKSL